MGESVGKEWNREHTKKLYTGVTPTVSIGSTDLHSMAQLYLGGPADKVTTFISVVEDKQILTLPDREEYDQLVEDIRGKKMKVLSDAILEGVKAAFRKAARPYTEVLLPDKSEHSIGQLLQFKMVEMMYLGFLLEVNPFDQPNVESYKEETRGILGKR
jgi:glucose-6-phosphate isomerase